MERYEGNGLAGDVFWRRSVSDGAHGAAVKPHPKASEPSQARSLAAGRTPTEPVVW